MRGRTALAPSKNANRVGLSNMDSGAATLACNNASGVGSGWHGNAEGRRQRGVDPEGTAPLTKPWTPWSISARPPARPWTTKITEIPFKYHPSQRPHRLSFRLSDISTIRRSPSLVNAAASQNAFGRDQSFPIPSVSIGRALNLSPNCPPKGYMIPVCKNR